MYALHTGSVPAFCLKNMDINPERAARPTPDVTDDDFKGKAVARLTGLEPATPGVTGRYSNQLSYNRASACPAYAERALLLSAHAAPVKRP